MRLFQPHRNTGLVCLALMAGLPLFAQLAADPFPTSIRVETRAMTTTPQQAAADSVTLQELTHSVPSRARREMERGVKHLPSTSIRKHSCTCFGPLTTIPSTLPPEMT
jgi:hypothetical protein